MHLFVVLHICIFVNTFKNYVYTHTYTHVCCAEDLKFLKTAQWQNLILQNPQALFTVKLILV